MVNQDAKRIDKVVRESLAEMGNRSIILSGWSGAKSPSSNDLLYMEYTPYDWIFPRCDIVIHHGGAGITAAGLCAGIPKIVVLFMADQPFWGGRLHTIDAGSKPIHLKDLSVESLTGAVAEAEIAVVRKHAQAIGQ